MPSSTGAQGRSSSAAEAEPDRGVRARGRGRRSASPARRRRRRRPATRRAGSPPSPRICRRIAGRSLVVAGDAQPPAVHALAHAMNAGARQRRAARSSTPTPSKPRPIDQLQSLRELVADMNAGTVDLLLILGGNPVYTAPADLKFAEAMDKVPLRVHLEPATTTRRRRSATGTFPRRTSSRRGATRAPSTAPCRSSSR